MRRNFNKQLITILEAITLRPEDLKHKKMLGLHHEQGEVISVETRGKTLIIHLATDAEETIPPEEFVRYLNEVIAVRRITKIVAQFDPEDASNLITALDYLDDDNIIRQTGDRIYKVINKPETNPELYSTVLKKSKGYVPHSGTKNKEAREKARKSLPQGMLPRLITFHRDNMAGKRWKELEDFFEGMQDLFYNYRTGDFVRPRLKSLTTYLLNLKESWPKGVSMVDALMSQTIVPFIKMAMAESSEYGWLYDRHSMGIAKAIHIALKLRIANETLLEQVLEEKKIQEGDEDEVWRLEQPTSPVTRLRKARRRFFQTVKMHKGTRQAYIDILDKYIKFCKQSAK